MVVGFQPGPWMIRMGLVGQGEARRAEFGRKYGELEEESEG